MAKPKKKFLPKDFEQLLKSGDLSAMKAVFDTCQLDARGGYSKKTALGFNECPDELTRWLIEQGANIEEPDSYGETPLHSRSSHWQGHIAILLELGADLECQSSRLETPLHKAAKVGNADNVSLLLAHGASPEARDASGLTPLGSALHSCHNAKIVEIADVAEILLAASVRPVARPSILSRLFGPSRLADDSDSESNRQAVERIGTQFEFHRQGYNPDSVDAASTALEKLYRLFDVPPVPRRIVHDGKASICAKSAKWEDAHQELWELLVPSSGAATTVQGEVVRASGRIHIELYENDGANWDADYRRMADALLVNLGSANALPAGDLAEATRIIKSIRSGNEHSRMLCKFAVDWVKLNPKPLDLCKPDYRR